MMNAISSPCVYLNLSAETGHKLYTEVTMVLGVGTDLIEIERIAQSVSRFGMRFLHRVYSAREIAYCQTKRNAAESFAARFAAKEAAAKALGTGISHGISWLEIEVVRLPSGKPSLQLTGRALNRARALGVARSSLSLTHSKNLAMAFVVMEDGVMKD